MKEERISIGAIPAVVYGEPSDRAYLFVHGKCGNKEEGKEFAEIICSKGWQVLSVDMPGTESGRVTSAPTIPGTPCRTCGRP